MYTQFTAALADQHRHELVVQAADARLANAARKVARPTGRRRRWHVKLRPAHGLQPRALRPA
ncbi:MAG: hypothetical protein QOG80_2373 [Pseudonocardiales bacterium]|jgi:hypothetical protein|nr:hypothetical protein [Pseudonocardiales bacterium]